MARIVAFTAKALDGSGLPLIRDEETDGSNCQVTARVRMVPPRAFPRNLVTPYRCSLQMESWISHRSSIQRPSPCYLEAENIPHSGTFFRSWCDRRTLQMPPCPSRPPASGQTAQYKQSVCPSIPS